MAIAIVAALSGCGGKDESAPPPSVVASTSQMADLVREVGGTAVKVTGLAPPLVNTHTWTPPSDAGSSIGKSKLVFLSGGDTDRWIEPAIAEAQAKSKVVDLSESAKLIRSGGQINSHWYTDLRNVKLAATKVASELTAANPAAKETYDANLSTYLGKVQDMDDSLQYCISLPKGGKLRVVSGHDDLDYVARRYGFTLVGQLTKRGADAATDADVSSTTREARSGKAQVVTVPWAENDPEAAVVAFKLDIPKNAILTDATSDKNLAAETLLRSVAYSMNVIVSGATNGNVTCSDAIGTDGE